MATLFEYLSTFWPKWLAVVSAFALFAIEPLARAYWPWLAKQIRRLDDTTRRGIEIVILVIAIFWAGYSAWLEEHEMRLKLESSAVSGTARHLTNEERLHFVSDLRSSPPISGKIEIMSTCDECEEYAQEFRDAMKSVTGLDVTGGAGMFATAANRGIKIVTPSSDRPPLAQRFARALDSAALRYEWGEQKNIEALGKDYLLVVIGRPLR
jgi:hypothetical protein